MKRRHHYLSKFYLENFIDPLNQPFIWIYEKGNTDIKKATAGDIAVKRDYYAFLSITGEKDTETFENMLSDIENNAAPVCRKIINREILSAYDQITFAAFLAFTMIRVPYFRDKITRVAKFVTKTRMQAMATDSNTFDTYVKKLNLKDIIINQEQVRKYIQKGNYEIKISSFCSLETMPLMAADLITIFLEMFWYLLVSAPETTFVTSDNPVVYFNQQPDTVSTIKGFKEGLKNKYTEISFPISKDIIFLGT